MQEETSFQVSPFLSMSQCSKTFESSWEVRPRIPVFLPIRNTLGLNVFCTCTPEYTLQEEWLKSVSSHCGRKPRGVKNKKFCEKSKNTHCQVNHPDKIELNQKLLKSASKFIKQRQKISIFKLKKHLLVVGNSPKID